MNRIADVYDRLMAMNFKEGISLSITDDKSLITIVVNDDLICTADDDMIGFRRKKKCLGITHYTYSHAHPATLNDLYQQLVLLLTADAI